MTARGKLAGVAVGLFLAGWWGQVEATPSSTDWTPATTDVQPCGVPHLGVDNYSTFFRKSSDGGGDFPTDYGLTLGVLPFDKVQMEVGIDVLEPSDDPLYFNAKIGSPEGSLFDGSPALNVGLFNVGTKRGVTDQNVGFLLVGKTLPLSAGRIHAGPYLGNGTVLRNSDGDKENRGFMVGYDKGFLPTRDSAGSAYNRVVIAADYISGDNALGGGGVGVYCFLTKDISLLAGPVWFNNQDIDGEMKWTLQLDVNLPSIFKK